MHCVSAIPGLAPRGNAAHLISNSCPSCTVQLLKHFGLVLAAVEKINPVCLKDMEGVFKMENTRHPVMNEPMDNSCRGRLEKCGGEMLKWS